MRRLRTTALLIASLAGLSLPVQGASAASFRVVADHLDNPRGLFADSQGGIWLAEAGRAGKHCLFAGSLCYGRTGKILHVVRGRLHTFASGLASIRERGFGTTGADDVSVAASGTVLPAMIFDDWSLPSAIRRSALSHQLGALLGFGRPGR